MGWACSNCGDVNPSLLESCAECHVDREAKGRTRLEPLPLSPNLIWIAALLGGVLAAYCVAIWNLRVLRAKPFLPTGLVYAVIAVGGWILTVIIIAHLTPPASGEIGFAIPVALALGFLLASIPYNRDSLPASQWMWSHPLRKLVFRIGGADSGLHYDSFVKVEGGLFGSGDKPESRLSIPILPLLLVIVSAILGAVTILIGSAIAVK